MECCASGESWAARNLGNKGGIAAQHLLLPQEGSVLVRLKLSRTQRLPTSG